MTTPIIKIVPMPGPQGPSGSGGSGNGATGPTGPQGTQGAGYAQILVDGSQLPSTPGNFTIALDGPLPSSWVAGMGIRLTTYNISNASPISGIYAEGYIQQIFNEDNHFVFQSLTSRGGPWGIGDKQVMSMTVAGTPGSDGIDANTGNFVFNGNNVTTDENMGIAVNGVPGRITLSAYEGVDIEASQNFGLRFPDNTVQTTAYNPSLQLQSVRWTPSFTATGLTFTGSGATHPTYNSYYVKHGQLVSFWIAVDCSTVTSFGTGQLNLELPFAPLAGTMNHFSGWVFVDETANPDLAGHIIVNADHLPNTQTLDLHYIKQSGGANSPVMEAMLTQNTPVVLTTATNIYVNGTYIAAS